MPVSVVSPVPPYPTAIVLPFQVPPEKVPLVTVPEKVGVVIVGDVAQIKPQLDALGLPIELAKAPAGQ